MESKEIYRIMFEAIKSGSIDEVLYGAYQVFGMPVSVCDDTFEMIAKNYPPIPQGDECWDIPLKEQKVPLEIVQLFQQHKIIEMQEENPQKPVYLNWGWFETHPRITTAVVIDGSIAGYTAVLCPAERYEPWHDEALRIVADAIAIVLQRQRQQFEGSNVILKSFIRDLIMGNIQTSEDLEKWEKLVNVKIKGNYVLLAFSTSDENKKGTAAYIKKQLQYSEPSILLHIADDMVYGLLYNQSVNEKAYAIPANITKTLNFLGTSCGISNKFAQLKEISVHKEQAFIALNTGKRLDPMYNEFWYKDYVLPAILLGTMDRIQPENCIHPALYQLSKYDREYNTSYFETLRSYIANHHSTRVACDKMHIHRNTLMYRLKKAEEITGIDIQSQAVDAHLVISFQILELMNKLGKIPDMRQTT
ncbi:MAG: PucR family transcriptional regulator [Clostridiaceae bacterium]